MERKLIAKACAAGLLVACAPALATFHLMKVVEVFPGTAVAPNAQYVVIQMYAAGQQFVGGHAITVFNGAGTLTGTFTFPGNLPNGANQAKILIATSQAESFFGLTADLIMSPSILSAGGKVCWAGTLDCVAWGAYTGGSAGVGTPFNASTGLVSGRAAVRRLNIAGSASTLDAGDDTDNSATDFVLGLPAPRNNAGVLGTPPMATCGNGVLEGLEQCDDHNLANGDGCSSTCLVEAKTATAHPIGDFNGDGKSDLLWRNSSTGADVIWQSGNIKTPMAVTGVTDQHWVIAGRGDFNGDGKADILWRNTSTGADVIWKSGNIATPQAVATVANLAWKIVGVGDFSDDGEADILWRNSSTGADAIWEDGNAAKAEALAPVSLAWKVVGIADFNGDHKADILWRNTSTGANSIWKSGSSSTPQSVVGVTNQAWKIVGVGDFNGDGRADIFWRNTSTGADTIWKSADASTLQVTMGVTSQSWQVATVGDFNGDGKVDVIWRNFATGANALWPSGSASGSQLLSSVTNLAWQIVPYENQPIGTSTASAAPQLSIADVSLTEGNTGSKMATFLVSLDHPSNAAATYDIATANLTALAGSDYIANSLTGQTIPAGATSKAFSVTIQGDAIVEPNETFRVDVSHVTGATVARGSAIGTIINDDMSPYPG